MTATKKGKLHVNFQKVNRTEQVHILWPAMFFVRMNFIHKTNNKRAQTAMTPPKKNINDLHVKLQHPSKTITVPLLKPLVSKSLVSNHVKIALWVRPSYMQSANRLYLVQKF